jgi:hypothetical protein
VNAAILLANLSAASVRLAVIEHSTLRYQGDQSTVDHWLPQIRQSKAELLALLSDDTGPAPLAPDQRNGIHEANAERAAILEYEAGMARPQAEAQVRGAMRVYRYRLTDRPADWLVIAPDYELDEARRSLIARFGIARLIEVQIHRPEIT